MDRDLEKNRKAGRIIKELKEEMKERIDVGSPLRNIAEFVEESIVERGAHPAFPCNVSLNNIAAHYTPSPDDESVISRGDLVKVDIGVHIDGFIADSAFTVDFGENRNLVKAADKALSKGIEIINREGSGVKISKISSAIEDEINKHGFKPIANLSGHLLERWTTHASPSIPNVSVPTKDKLKEGDVVAIEPFVTNGSGRVKEGDNSQIFSCMDESPRIRDRASRKIMENVIEEYKTLPFAKRWISSLDIKRSEFALRKLVRSNILREYPPLKEIDDGDVAQSENTLIVKEDGCEIIT